MGATRALVASVRGLRLDDIPEPAREVARHCVLDLLGVAVAGAREPLVEILVDATLGADAGGDAGLVGRSERTPALAAALVNGAAGHALDFDDTHWTMNGHPTVPVLPALLALAEREGASGGALLAALVAGIELECRLGALLGSRHYEVGFHATGTLGTFGAAAACAHLLGLDESAWLHALGLAGTSAAGLKSGFGTMAKPLHAGRAAQSGLLAALLAQRGFTAQTAIVEVAQGFAATHAGNDPDATLLDRFAGRFFVRETLFKHHASCYLTHAPIEAARALRAHHGIEPETIDAIEVAVAPTSLRVCNLAEPKTGLEGKFSLRVTTALALLDVDTAALETFEDARMADPRLVALRDKVSVVAEPGLGAMRASVRVRAEGRSFDQAADTGVPEADLAKQRAALLGKFRALVAPRLGPARAEALAELALGTDALPRAAALVEAARCSAA